MNPCVMTRRGYETGDYRTIPNIVKDKKECSGITTFCLQMSACAIFLQMSVAMFFVFTCDALVCFAMYV